MSFNSALNKCFVSIALPGLNEYVSLRPRNGALKVNPINLMDEALTVHGSDWLWAATAIFSLALVRRSSLLPESPCLNLPAHHSFLPDRLPVYVFRSKGKRTSLSLLIHLRPNGWCHYIPCLSLQSGMECCETGR